MDSGRESNQNWVLPTLRPRELSCWSSWSVYPKFSSLRVSSSLRVCLSLAPLIQQLAIPDLLSLLHNFSPNLRIIFSPLLSSQCRTSSHSKSPVSVARTLSWYGQPWSRGLSTTSGLFDSAHTWAVGLGCPPVLDLNVPTTCTPMCFSQYPSPSPKTILTQRLLGSRLGWISFRSSLEGWLFTGTSQPQELAKELGNQAAPGPSTTWG